jgi:membrane-bound serine protease (ClpP class)
VTPIRTFLVLFLAGVGLSAALQAADRSPRHTGPYARAFLIPIDREIDDTLSASVERRVEEAKAAGADFIIFEVDSPGGMVSSSIDIGDLIFALEVPNVALILKGAYSGAALVSLAAGDIVMGDGAILGDCQPIIAGPGGIEVIGEKIQSPLRALFRKYADRNGYPRRLAEAMVTEQMEVRRVTFPDGTVDYLEPAEVVEEAKVRGEPVSSRVVVKAGELLTLHAREALENGFTGPLVRNRAEAFARWGLTEGRVTRLEESWAESVSRFLLSIKALLFLGGIVALWMELKAPGFGVPGAIAIICFALFFSASAVAGIATEIEIVLFLLGVLLLILELFVIPGFGVAGVAGIGLIVVSLYMASVKYAFPGGGRPFDLRNLGHFLLEFAAAFVGATVIAAFLARLLPRTWVGRRIILEPAGGVATLTGSAVPASASALAAALVGRGGVALTTLRPAGRIEVDGEPFDALSEGDYIEQGSSITVLRAEGNEIVVKKN